MISQKSHNQFHPITKQSLQKDMEIKDVDELCGVASVTMLFEWCGEDRAFKDIYSRMAISGSYVKGEGTYLRLTARAFPKLRYLRYAPTGLLRVLLALGYCMAASIKKTDDTNHIIFVCGKDHQKIYYYDPNRDEKQKSMSYRDWNAVSNRRVVILKINKSPKNYRRS